MKFRQGKAPAILYQDGERVFEFSNGRLETDDVKLIAILLERGAEGEGESGVRSVEPPVIPSEAPAPPVTLSEATFQRSGKVGLPPITGDSSPAARNDKPGEKPADKPSRKRTKAAP